MRTNLPTRVLNLAVAVLCSLLLIGAFSTSVRADELNKLTKVTISGPVEIPGFHGTMVLPAGTYVFKILDMGANRNIVQIFNEDQTQLYATIVAVPNYRLTPTDKTVITFEERPVNTPQAIKAWFYPGDTFGQEFVYPRPQAVQIAQAANQPVLSMPEAEAPNITKPITSAQQPAAVALERAPVTAEEPSGTEVPLGQAVQSRPAPSGNQMAANTLPKTASDMPLAALAGILLVGMGIGFRLLSRKLA
jgi:LPXTG-motif cell wall-anchored protein